MYAEIKSLHTAIKRDFACSVRSAIITWKSPTISRDKYLCALYSGIVWGKTASLYAAGAIDLNQKNKLDCGILKIRRESIKYE